ncbi:MAG: alcohol dehydrogenase catalytic domain-containing protein [Actinomycetota bacterium]
MRAAVLDAVGGPIRLTEEHPEPMVSGTEEVIDVTACGVCHSDLHVVDGDFGSTLPMILGHEVTGVHAELGPVMVYAPWGCGGCEQCAEGLDMICADATEAGLFADGGYAQRMRIPHRYYLSPLEGLDPVASAPLACGGLTAYRAVQQTLEVLRRPGPRRRRALVIGAGGLGQYAIRYLKLLTDVEVYALDLSAAKRATAMELGADHAVGPDDGLPPIDGIIDFIGSDTTLTAASATVAKQGAVVVVGLFGGRIPFGLGAVPHEARFLSSFWGSRPQLDELLDLARREPGILAPVEAVPLSEAQRAHERLRAGEVEGRLVLVTD